MNKNRPILKQKRLVSRETFSLFYFRFISIVQSLLDPGHVLHD